MSIRLLAGVGVCALGAVAIAGPVKKAAPVPGQAALQRLVGELYAKKHSTTDHEKILVRIDKVLSRDGKEQALKTPRFWARAIQEARFGGRARKSSRPKVVAEVEVEVVHPGTDEPSRVSLAYHGGALYKDKARHTLLLTYLERGQDAKAWVEAFVEAYPEARKRWIVAAIAESDAIPLCEQPTMGIYPLLRIRRMFSIDAGRVYLQGVGATCRAVQSLASRHIPDRIAAIVLREPRLALITENSRRFSTLVIQGAQGRAVGEVYRSLDDRNATLPLDASADAGLVAWIEDYGGRELPAAGTFETLLETGNRAGETWTGTLDIVSVGERGRPTRVSARYDRAANRVSVDSVNLAEFRLFLNDELVDLDRNVTIVVNGRKQVDRRFGRDLRAMLRTAEVFGEYGHLFVASYRGNALPAD